MHLRTMQQHLPWTIPYSEKFEDNKSSYADMQHALMHIVKSAGIIAGLIDQYDHGEQPDYSFPEIRKRTCDFVMCALRIANTAPNGAFDLQSAVLNRMSSVNNTDIRDLDIALTNTEILMYVLGWQGGTIHQLSKELGVKDDVILDANADKMRELIALAQMIRNKREK